MGCFGSSVSLGELPGVTCGAGRSQISLSQSVLGKMGFCTRLWLCSGSPVGSRDSGGVRKNQLSLFAGEAAFFFPWKVIGVGLGGKAMLRCSLVR